MNYKNKRLLSLILLFVLIITSACVKVEQRAEETTESNPVNTEKIQEEVEEVVTEEGLEEVEEREEESSQIEVVEGEWYYEVEDVAAYVHTYGRLPDNYITKNEAKKMNWSADDTNGFVVGGDKFGNREGNLPDANGRQYFEADIEAGYTDHRGPLRLVFSNDGLIFYTEDHYESFEQLY